MWGSVLGSVAPKLVDGILSLFGVESSASQEKKLEAQKLVTKLAMEEIRARNLQLEVNKAEAANPNRKWISWRELVGYVSAFAFAWSFVFQPFLVFLLTVAGKSIDIPSLDLSQLLPVLLGMLGLSGSRSYEKIQKEKIRAGISPKSLD